MSCSIAALGLGALTFCLLATFPGWREEQHPIAGSDIDIKPFPSRPVSQVAAWAVGMASLLLLVSALWQHIAASTAAFAVKATTQEQLKTAVGTTAMALGWLAFALFTVVFLGLITMMMSLRLFDRLTDD